MQRRRADDPRFRLCKRRRIEHEWLRLRSAEPAVAPDQFFEGGDFAGGRFKQAVNQEVRCVPERVRPFQMELGVWAKGVSGSLPTA